MTEAEEDALLLAEAASLVDAMRAVLDGKHMHAILTALDEIYGRVLSDAFDDPDELERALAKTMKHLRGWWLADRGGPFLPS